MCVVKITRPPVRKTLRHAARNEVGSSSAGTSTLELKHGSSDTYVYRSRNVARGVFRLAFPDAITQTSTMTLGENGIKPLTYGSDDGSKNTDRDVSLVFDWNAQRVRGTAENEPVDVPLQPGVQDPLSVQVQLMSELAAGRSPTRFLMIDKDEVKEYEYVRERTETIDTPLGKLETVVYRSQRIGSDRSTRLWLAPSLGYVPVRAERRRGDRIDFSMQLRELKKG